MGGSSAREGEGKRTPPLLEGDGKDDGLRGRGHSSSRLKSPEGVNDGGRELEGCLDGLSRDAPSQHLMAGQGACSSAPGTLICTGIDSRRLWTSRGWGPGNEAAKGSDLANSSTDKGHRLDRSVPVQVPRRRRDQCTLWLHSRHWIRPAHREVVVAQDANLKN